MKDLKLITYLVSNTPFSRRKLTEMIKNGDVRVNNKIVESFSLPITPSRDTIKINGNPVTARTPLVYYKFHKPYNIISTLDDPKNRKELSECFKQAKLPKSVFPVGRLDRKTTGLMLATNDGNFANKILHPRHKIEKRYRVTLDKKITAQLLNQIEAGITLEDGPVRCSYLEIASPKSLILGIKEGRNRIVRRLFEAVNFEVKKLHRLSIGPLLLGNLKPGEAKRLSQRELNFFIK